MVRLSGSVGWHGLSGTVGGTGCACRKEIEIEIEIERLRRRELTHLDASMHDSLTHLDVALPGVAPPVERHLREDLDVLEVVHELAWKEPGTVLRAWGGGERDQENNDVALV